MRTITLYINYLFIFFSTVVIFSEDSTNRIKPKFPYSNNYRSEYLDKSHLTILGFTIGEDSLHNVMKKLGQTEIIKDDYYHRSEIICYSALDEDDSTKIMFIKNPLADLLGFCLLSGKIDFIANLKCKKLNIINKNISTDSGLHLGMLKNDLLSILGNPDKSTEHSLTYIYHIKEIMDEETINYYLDKNKHSIPPISREDLYWDIMSTLKADFKNEKLIKLEVIKTVTY